MRVTINDIAKKANVSPSTVSRVIANNPRISSTTSEKVLKIMKEMNYHPNMIARSLANRSTKIIGVIVPGAIEKAFQHPFFPEILRGIASEAHKNTYNILISSVTEVKDEKQVINELAKGGIAEGIILMTSRMKDPSIAELIKINFPFVVIGRSMVDSEINWVDNDNFSVAYELTKHFINQGHKKIALIGVSKQVVVTLDRLEGYKKALLDSNLEIDEGLIVEGKFFDDIGYGLMKKILDEGARPTGVIACDDVLAFGAIKLLTEYGLKIPDDIAVAGFNNLPLSDYSTPSLTSVEVNAFGLGAKAFQLLIKSINSNYEVFNKAIVPAQLVIRNSTLKQV
ncbi:MAG: LacI family transcriptional regulator [Clostridia bacterium]|nr:LacI family transcriptional regulator [Clostridia bacterium]